MLSNLFTVSPSTGGSAAQFITDDNNALVGNESAKLNERKQKSSKNENEEI